MKTIIKVFLVLVVAGAVTGGWILANGGSKVGLAKEILPPLESQAGPARVLPDPLPLFPTVFECFLTTPGVPQDKGVWLWTENFGDDFVRVQHLVVLCEGAVKTGPDLINQNNFVIFPFNCF